ncbi:MAG: hypothetical protein E7167_01385 [Firmicutes bacterium]|nr:hypothetical protein [Bacillota bacterium]
MLVFNTKFVYARDLKEELNISHLDEFNFIHECGENSHVWLDTSDEGLQEVIDELKFAIQEDLSEDYITALQNDIKAIKHLRNVYSLKESVLILFFL